MILALAMSRPFTPTPASRPGRLDRRTAVTQAPKKLVSVDRKSIFKPLPPGWFVDHREVDAAAGEENDLALNAETCWEAMADEGYLTPNELFFVRNHAPTPHIDAYSWKLRVDGPGVRKSLELDYDDLLRMENVSAVRALEWRRARLCFLRRASRPRGAGDPVEAWGDRGGGVDRRLAGSDTRAGGAEEHGTRGDAREPRWHEDAASAAHREGSRRGHAPGPRHEVAGEPLPPSHGFPARVVVSRWAAVASVKWVGRMHVSEGPLFSPWNTEKYVMTGGDFGEKREPVTEQVVKSALELAWSARIPQGRQEIRGRSWSPHGAISRVEYSVDGGPWRRARLLEPNIPGRGCAGCSPGMRAPVNTRYGSKLRTRGATASPRLCPTTSSAISMPESSDTQ